MAMELVAREVRDYLHQFVPARPPEMHVMEAYARKNNFPIIGPVAGSLCYQLARMIQARQIFELGSGYGYSTAWFAQAVRENGGGVVHHVVWDEELSQQAQKHLTALGLQDLVQFHMGEAVQELKDTNGPFDLIFNDIDKHGYPAALPVINAKLRSGGVLIVDNMLWSGRIFDEQDQSPDTKGIREFSEMIRKDDSWITTLIPIRDGLVVAYKK